MSLSPEQSDDLRRLITGELRAAVRAAAEQGAGPAAVTELLDQCRSAVRASAAAGDDADGLRHDAFPDPGVGEQR